MLTYTQARLKDVKSGADAPIVVRVYGNEHEALSAKAKEVGDAVGKIKGIKDLQVEVPVYEPTLEVEVDLEKAQQYGIKPGDVRRAAAYLLAGVEVGQLFYDQKIFEVVVWGTPEIRQDEAAIRNLLIDTPSGGQVRLEEVADVRRVDSPDVVEREGRLPPDRHQRRRDRPQPQRRGRRRQGGDQPHDFPLEFRAELLGNYADKKAAESACCGSVRWPPSAWCSCCRPPSAAGGLGLLFALSLPVALVGGVVAALADGGTVTIGSAVGLLTVLGIAARNGIVLIRRYQHLQRREGLAFGLDLVLKGARERLAPTLMTALATGLVFLPVLVLGDRAGYEVLHPMAIVILGGLVTATLVNVFVTPGHLPQLRERQDRHRDRPDAVRGGADRSRRPAETPTIARSGADGRSRCRGRVLEGADEHHARIVAASLRFRFLVIALAAALMFVGVGQIKKMPVDVFPEFSPPKVEIQTLGIGLAPADIENLITVPHGGGAGRHPGARHHAVPVGQRPVPDPPDLRAGHGPHARPPAGPGTRWTWWRPTCPPGRRRR